MKIDINQILLFWVWESQMRHSIEKFNIAKKNSAHVASALGTVAPKNSVAFDMPSVDTYPIYWCGIERNFDKYIT
jgi:hypothetical protein